MPIIYPKYSTARSGEYVLAIERNIGDGWKKPTCYAIKNNLRGWFLYKKINAKTVEWFDKDLSRFIHHPKELSDELEKLIDEAPKVDKEINTMQGMITPTIEKLSMEFLEHKLGVHQLRFIRYLHTVMANEQKFDEEQMSPIYRAIFAQWIDQDYVSGSVYDFDGLTIQKPFWDFISEIVWLAYVDYENQPTIDDPQWVFEYIDDKFLYENCEKLAEFAKFPPYKPIPYSEWMDKKDQQPSEDQSKKFIKITTTPHGDYCNSLVDHLQSWIEESEDKMHQRIIDLWWLFQTMPPNNAYKYWNKPKLA